MKINTDLNYTITTITNSENNFNLIYGVKEPVMNLDVVRDVGQIGQIGIITIINRPCGSLL